jgi:catechol 2,3-dioxygenase-like lactoylglutathione lyase family enzyme
MDFKLEVVVLPVSEVDRAKDFYKALGLQLVVDDISAARDELTGRGAEVSEVFHDEGGVFHHVGTAGRVTGPAPENASYGSFVSFSDPDGNQWFVQEVTTRLPGR